MVNKWGKRDWVLSGMKWALNAFEMVGWFLLTKNKGMTYGIGADIPGPHCHGVPFFDFKSWRRRWLFLLWCLLEGTIEIGIGGGIWIRKNRPWGLGNGNESTRRSWLSLGCSCSYRYGCSCSYRYRCMIGISRNGRSIRCFRFRFRFLFLSHWLTSCGASASSIVTSFVSSAVLMLDLYLLSGCSIAENSAG